MLLPLGTDRRLQHRPYVNIGLIVINVAVSLWVWGRFGPPMLHTPVGPFMLLPWQPQLHQFFTYQFLHADWEHLIFNMLFLYVFGNALEDRLGPLGYAAFYLAGGVVAGVGYSLTQSNPILGASGSIAAVTGAFLALLPLTRVTILFWFFFIYFFEIPAIFLILFSVGQDFFFNLLQWTGRPVGNVAYLAHLSGNGFGFLVGMALLATRILPREPYDFLALADRWHRRRQWHNAVRTGPAPATPRSGRSDALTERAMRMRAAITEALQTHDHSRALDTYERLLAGDPSQIMPREVQLELANYAMSHDRHGTAASAYELFLKTWPRDPQTDQVQLLLGLIYAKYLDRPDRARDLLTEALKKLTDPAQRRLAEELLATIGD